MEIVIKLPDKKYEALKMLETATIGLHLGVVEKAIINGTPLPKGHGDLVDKSKIRKAIPAEEDNCTGMGMTLEEMGAYNEGVNAMYSLVQRTPTIIEADKEEQNERLD